RLRARHGHGRLHQYRAAHPDLTDVGIAQTLCSLAPIFILPFAAIVHHEAIGYRAVIGAVVSVAGAALLL
ncbi:MAG: EamA family transporter, partial [Phycisphaerae bacterium]